jgi:hypothetical protein
VARNGSGEAECDTGNTRGLEQWKAKTRSLAQPARCRHSAGWNSRAAREFNPLRIHVRANSI